MAKLNKQQITQAILDDRKRRSELKGTRTTAQDILMPILQRGVNVPSYQFRTLLQCPPGTRFETADCPAQGHLVSITQGSARVLWRNGKDERIAPTVRVYTLPPAPLVEGAEGKAVVKRSTREAGPTALDVKWDKVKAVLSTQPQTMKQLMEKAGCEGQRPYRHMKQAIADGLVVKEGETFRLVSK